jgi:hypothetical protein
MGDPLRSPATNGQSLTVARYKWAIPLRSPATNGQSLTVAHYKRAIPFLRPLQRGDPFPAPATNGRSLSGARYKWAIPLRSPATNRQSPCRRPLQMGNPLRSPTTNGQSLATTGYTHLYSSVSIHVAMDFSPCKPRVNHRLKSMATWNVNLCVSRSPCGRPLQMGMWKITDFRHALNLRPIDVLADDHPVIGQKAFLSFS